MDWSLIVKPNRSGLSCAVINPQGEIEAAFAREADALAFIAGKIALEHVAA